MRLKEAANASCCMRDAHKVAGISSRVAIKRYSRIPDARIIYGAAGFPHPEREEGTRPFTDGTGRRVPKTGTGVLFFCS